MASFVHVADERDAGRLRRNGIRGAKGRDGIVGVFCVPVVPNFQMTYQWVRELKRRGNRSSCAVQFRIGDGEDVLVGRYGQPPTTMSAAEAVKYFLLSPDARGLEVRISRSIAPREIAHIRAMPRAVGWRYFPEAKGRAPFWPLTPGIKTRRLKNTLEKKMQS